MEKKDIQVISAEELKELMNAGKDHAGHDVKVINVLDHDSFVDCRIKGSSNIELHDFPVAVKEWDRAIPFILYCGSSQCPLSKQAAQVLLDMGFTNVKAYEGGMKEWHDLDYPSEGSCVADYLSKSEPETTTCSGCNNTAKDCSCE